MRTDSLATSWRLSILVLLAAAYIGVLLYFSPLPLQDYPNHLARAVIMSDLMFDQGRQFGSAFELQYLFASYALGDWILATMVHYLGTPSAAAIWAVLVFLSFPLALLAYLRARRIPTDTTILLLLLSLYLDTDVFLMRGFLSFRLGVAAVLLALAAIESLRRKGSPWKYLLFCLIVVGAYLTHLAAIAFIAVGLGTTALVRMYLKSFRLWREAFMWIPLGAVGLWQVLRASQFRRPDDLVTDSLYWGTVSGKLIQGASEFCRYLPSKDGLFLACLGVCMVAAVASRGRVTRKDLLQPQVFEAGVLGIAFLGTFIALPSTYSEASFVDQRAMALAPLFLVLACLNLRVGASRVAGPGALVGAEAVACASADAGAGVGAASRPFGAAAGWVLWSAAMLLVSLNLAYLTKHIRAQSEWLAQYRAVLDKLPEHALVFPVHTAHAEGCVRPYLHAASFVVIDRNGLTPYLFSGDTGAPMKYFRYRNRPYAPEEAWYTSHGSEKVDWQSIAATYPFLLLMKPFDPQRIPLTSHVISENSVATLVALH